MLVGSNVVGLVGTLISELNCKGNDSALAEAESVISANIINTTVNPLIYNTLSNY